MANAVPGNPLATARKDLLVITCEHGGREVPRAYAALFSGLEALDGVVARRADVAWLYDPRRSGEVAFAHAWMMQLTQRAPELRLRRNYPYQGRGDGLTALLRKRHPDDTYVGIELEVNQRIVALGGEPWCAVRAKLIESLAKTLAGASDGSAS
jgi:hypothetical protein